VGVSSRGVLWAVVVAAALLLVVGYVLVVAPWVGARAV
jgi:hypothetical protein